MTIKNPVLALAMTTALVAGTSGLLVTGAARASDLTTTTAAPQSASKATIKAKQEVAEANTKLAEESNEDAKDANEKAADATAEAKEATAKAMTANAHADMAKADAATANGHAQLAASTANAVSGAPVSKVSITAQLQAAGYTDIDDVELNDGIWTADATDPKGTKLMLILDGKDGHILTTGE